MFRETFHKRISNIDLEGIAQGEISKAIEIAQNLLDVLDDQTIALKTGLSEASVRKLR